MRRPEHYLHQLLANHAVVLTGDRDASFDLRAIELDQILADHFVAQSLDVARVK